MQHHDPTRPSITIGRNEHRKLLIVAMSAIGHSADDSDYVHHEFDRATVVADRKPTRDVAVGAALAGLRPGQSITRMGWYGSFARFNVLSVKSPDERN